AHRLHRAELEQRLVGEGLDGAQRLSSLWFPPLPERLQQEAGPETDEHAGTGVVQQQADPKADEHATGDEQRTIPPPGSSGSPATRGCASTAAPARCCGPSTEDYAGAPP